jgi:hypothetical protein
VNAAFLVIVVKLWSEELLEHVQIHGTGNGRPFPGSYSPDFFLVEIG